MRSRIPPLTCVAMLLCTKFRLGEDDRLSIVSSCLISSVVLVAGWVIDFRVVGIEITP